MPINLSNVNISIQKFQEISSGKYTGPIGSFAKLTFNPEYVA